MSAAMRTRMALEIHSSHPWFKDIAESLSGMGWGEPPAITLNANGKEVRYTMTKHSSVMDKDGITLQTDWLMSSGSGK